MPASGDELTGSSTDASPTPREAGCVKLYSQLGVVSACLTRADSSRPYPREAERRTNFFVMTRGAMRRLSDPGAPRRSSDEVDGLVLHRIGDLDRFEVCLVGLARGDHL